ncbi:hypothetical protein PG989_006524 [Apiospora arundinis]
MSSSAPDATMGGTGNDGNGGGSGNRKSKIDQTLDEINAASEARKKARGKGKGKGKGKGANLWGKRTREEDPADDAQQVARRPRLDPPAAIPMSAVATRGPMTWNRLDPSAPSWIAQSGQDIVAQTRGNAAIDQVTDIVKDRATEFFGNSTTGVVTHNYHLQSGHEQLRVARAAAAAEAAEKKRRLLNAKNKGKGKGTAPPPAKSGGGGGNKKAKRHRGGRRRGKGNGNAQKTGGDNDDDSVEDDGDNVGTGTGRPPASGPGANRRPGPFGSGGFQSRPGAPPGAAPAAPGGWPGYFGPAPAAPGSWPGFFGPAPAAPDRRQGPSRGGSGLRSSRGAVNNTEEFAESQGRNNFDPGAYGGPSGRRRGGRGGRGGGVRPPATTEELDEEMADYFGVNKVNAEGLEGNSAEGQGNSADGQGKSAGGKGGDIIQDDSDDDMDLSNNPS